MVFAFGTNTLGVPFNNTITVPSQDQRDAATQGALITDLIQHLYSIVLYDTHLGETIIDPSLDPGARTAYAEYFFRVPPKVHEFDEPFATSIVGTQRGGKYVESYGSIIKALRV